MKKVLALLAMAVPFTASIYAADLEADTKISEEDAPYEVLRWETDPQESADYTIMDTVDRDNEFEPEVLRHVVGIYNKSSYDVYYGSTWSHDVEFSFETLKKGRCTWAAIRNKEKDDWRLRVRFDFDMGPDAQFKFYSLRSKKSHHLTCEDGMRYVFKDMKNRDKKIMLYKMKGQGN